MHSSGLANPPLRYGSASPLSLVVMVYKGEIKMTIEFPGPAVPAEDGGISYRAIVDGKTVACKFSTEALQDVNPDLTMSNPADQFESSKARLLEIAERKISAGKIADGVVHIFTRDL